MQVYVLTVTDIIYNTVRAKECFFFGTDRFVYQEVIPSCRLVHVYHERESH